MTALWVLSALPAIIGGYAYVVYPLLLRLYVLLHRRTPTIMKVDEWPSITIVIPAYNEVSEIAQTLEGVLALDYPADRRQIVAVSDASNDGTDDIVAEFADRGIELLRMPERGGKTLAENAAIGASRGDIIVNIDASIRLPPESLKRLIAAFADGEVGVASGRDVSAGIADLESNGSEAGYVDLEMQLRALETRVGSIVGASGCFFAARRTIHSADFPAHLSKDFATPLRARRLGYRSVSVDGARCVVGRTPRLDQEYRRKVRTMARGLATLWHERDLLNPLRYGSFAWMLFSHKLARWLVFLTIPPALISLVVIAFNSAGARILCAAISAILLLGCLAIRSPAHRKLRPVLRLIGYLVASHAAGIMAWVTVIRGQADGIWQPTRRAEVS